MQNGLYVSLSAQISLSRRLDTIANNVANANTPGFRVDGVSFATQLAKAGEAKVSYVSPGETFVSMRAGSLVTTGNPLDAAVQGEGFFAVQQNGQTVYTRDGRMQMDETGGLTSLTGAPVLDAAGAPIQLDPGAGPPSIMRDGMILQDGRQLGALGLFQLDPAAKLTRAGTSGFLSDKQAQPILNFTAKYKNGPLVTLENDRIYAGYAFEVPAITCGAMTIEHIRLSAQLSLPLKSGALTFLFHTGEVTDRAAPEYRVYQIPRHEGPEPICESFEEWLRWVHQGYNPASLGDDEDDEGDSVVSGPSACPTMPYSRTPV